MKTSGRLGGSNRSAVTFLRAHTRIRVLSAISRTPRPTAGHSTAIDLPTNASGEVQAGWRADLVTWTVALADGYMMGAHRRGRAPREHDVRAQPERVLKERRAEPIHHRADRS